MRISDCSSDVCSSDLFPGYLRRAPSRRSSDGRDSRSRTRATTSPALALSQPANSAHSWNFVATSSKLIGLAGLPLPKSAMPEMRSEEHTSELQSLMRISYAVFCLQKKHTIKTTNKY